MSRTLRISLITGGVFVVLLTITPFLISVDRFRPVIERSASAALGRTVVLGPLSLSVMSGSVSAEGVAVGDDRTFSSAPFLTAKSVKVGVELWPLILSRSLNVTSITVDRPEVALIRNLAGQWNYASLGSSLSAVSAFSISKLELKDGRMIVASTTHRKRSTYDHVNARVSGLSLTSTSPVIVTAALPGDGTFKLAGNMGPLDLADASLTPLDATIAIDRMNLATTGFLNPAAGLGGLCDLQATIVSKRGEADIKGTAKVSKALLVAGGSPSSEPVVVEFNSSYSLRAQSGVLHPSTLKIGRAVARLDGSYDVAGEHAVVKINLMAEGMPATDLESFLPALGIHLPKDAHLATGTVEANLNVLGPTNRLVATGPGALFNAKVTGFDLGSKVGAISALGGLHTGRDLDIETLTTNLRIAQDGLRFDHVNAFVPSVGHVTGAGTIDARNNLNFGMVATLTSSLSNGIGAAVGAAGALGAGAAGAIGAGTAGAIGGTAGALGAGAAGALHDVFGVFGGHEAYAPSKGKSQRKGQNQGQGQRISFLIRGTTSDPQFIPDVGGFVLQTLEGPFGAKR